MSGTDSAQPKVFISYSHDSPEHRNTVLELANKLRGDGIDACIDQHHPWPNEGWPRWMERQLREANFVLLICTETYHRRVSGQEDPGSGRGVCWEATLIYNHLYQAKLESAKFVPVLLENESDAHIPSVLQGHPSFRIDGDDGYEELYRRLTNQPRALAGPVGELRKLPQLGSPKRSPGPDANQAARPVLTAESETKKFFISYPHGDPDEENLARFLHSSLTAIGHEAFIDIGMAAGTDWVREINDRIDWSDYLIVLLSEKSMRSEMVQTEVRLARRRQNQAGRPAIVPVRVRYQGPLEYELDMYIGHLQYVVWSGPEDSARVQEAVVRAVTGKSPIDDRETPRVDATAKSARASDDDTAQPHATRDTRSASVPGGTIRWDDLYYITRTQDRVVQRCAEEIGHTLVIKAPRQMGKSSLLLHYLSRCQQAEKKIAFIDFQVFSGSDMASYPKFLSTFARVLQHRLKIPGVDPGEIDSQFAMVQFIEDAVLPAVDGPLVIALDEVDRVFGQPYQDDFFTMLRLWHNNRSPLSPEWEDLDLALVISTEPYLLIEAGDRSPFNVGLLLKVDPFSKEDCVELDTRYPDVLSDAEVDELWHLLQGHPYLTRLSYYRLTAPDKISFTQLMDRAADERGPFGDHLRSMLVKLHEKEDLLDAMKQVIRSGTAPDRDLYYRLYGAGLVRKDGDRVNPANLLYARYFKRAL